MPVVPKDVFEKILKELENPSPPNQALIAAFKKYKEETNVDEELVYTHKQMTEVMDKCLALERAIERRDKGFAAEAAEYNAEIQKAEHDLSLANTLIETQRDHIKELGVELQKAIEGIKIFYRESRTITPKMQDVIDDFCPELNE